MFNNKFSRAERVSSAFVARHSLRSARAFFWILIVILTFTSAAPRPASAWQIDVPLDQALVLAGGESTNPRQYDPHTTYGSGDKRVFSGLVSLDPQLNLTPDLAESWELSPDGRTYTFHLRPNAKFHNGKPVTAQLAELGVVRVGLAPGGADLSDH